VARSPNAPGAARHSTRRVAVNQSAEQDRRLLKYRHKVVAGVAGWRFAPGLAVADTTVGSSPATVVSVDGLLQLIP
jgi:hypothetical protein